MSLNPSRPTWSQDTNNRFTVLMWTSTLEIISGGTARRMWRVVSKGIGAARRMWLVVSKGIGAARPLHPT